MNLLEEDTFSVYKNNADFWVVSEPSPLEAKLDVNFRSFSNGEPFPNAKFFPNHDVFHFAFERGWMHHVYKVRTGNDLERFSSYTYHGESIVELCTRFFGNLENNLVSIDENDGELPTGEYIELPIQQLGVRKRNQPDRTFPILFRVLGKGSFHVTEKISLEAVIEYIRYVITASLVSGDVVDDFLKNLERKYDQQYWMNRKFFYSTDFKEMVRDFIRNPEKELPTQLVELNTFLLELDTSLEQAVSYCEKCLSIFYKIFLNPEFDQIFKTDTSYLFPLNSLSNKMTLMGYLFMINKSANYTYENTFKGLTIKNGVNPLVKRSLRILLSRLSVLEEEIFRLERIRSKILYENINISQKNLHEINMKLNLLRRQIQNIPKSSKELISKNTERYFGFCCLNTNTLDFN